MNIMKQPATSHCFCKYESILPACAVFAFLSRHFGDFEVTKFQAWRVQKKVPLTGRIFARLCIMRRFMHPFLKPGVAVGTHHGELFSSWC